MAEYPKLIKYFIVPAHLQLMHAQIFLICTQPLDNVLFSITALSLAHLSLLLHDHHNNQ